MHNTYPRINASELDISVSRCVVPSFSYTGLSSFPLLKDLPSTEITNALSTIVPDMFHNFDTLMPHRLKAKARVVMQTRDAKGLGNLGKNRRSKRNPSSTSHNLIPKEKTGWILTVKFAIMKRHSRQETHV
jgi:hypothetical protein